MKQLVETRSSHPFITRSSASQIASSAECIRAAAHSSQYRRQAPGNRQPNAGGTQQATSDGQSPIPNRRIPSEPPNEPILNQMLNKTPSSLPTCRQPSICRRSSICSRLSSGYLNVDSANKPSRSSRSTSEISGQPDERTGRRISKRISANMCRVNRRINKTSINEKINEKVIKTAYPNISDPNKRPDDRPGDHFDSSIRIDYFPTLQCFIFVNLIRLTAVFVNGQLDLVQAGLKCVHLSISRLVVRIRKFFLKFHRVLHRELQRELYRNLYRDLHRKLHRPRTSPRRLYRWLNVLLIFNCLLTCDAIKNQYNKAVGAVPGDLVLGALFPVHHAPGPAQAQTRTCGGVREQYGIQRVEAAFQTIDLINKDKRILPHIMLGLEIRDSCWYSPIALEQSIEFIRDAMAASEEQQLKEQQLAREEQEAREGIFSTKNMSAICPKQASVKNLVGVIGPASSTVTIQVQNLLQLFNIPQIGYSATSRDLSAKNYYKYFLRVVPSDLLQAQVMIEFIKRNNWTFISAIYTDGNYGSSLMEVFKNMAQEEGICIANTESVIHNAEDSKFDEIVLNLQEYKATAKVVACFCEGMTVRGILKAFRRLNATGDFQLFGSDGWSDRYDVVEGYEEEAVGGLSVRIHSPYVHEFDEYYFGLNPMTNTRNPWFREFWEWKFNCSLTSYNSTVRQCTGDEKLTERYKQDTKMAFVVKAIWTMAYGLHSMQQSLCPDSKELCKEMIPVNGSVFLSHLLNVSFEWNKERVLFDSNGDPPGRYDIMNFQKKLNGSYDYEMIGTWVSTNRFLNLTRYIHWPQNMTLNSAGVPDSVCSKPCKPGHAKNFQSDSMKCCWVCVPCRENQYMKNEYTCENCPIGWRPSNNLTGCLQIPVKYIQWSETPSLVAIAISVIGLIMTLFTMVVFIQHNNTPVVKASTKELSYLIMIGMILAYSTTFFLIAKPTRFNCLATRILPGFSFAVIYGSLVTKTNRIARILAGSKKRIMTKKPRFMSSASQVVISCLLVCIEIGILTFTLIKEPADSMLDYPSWDVVVLVCNTTSLGISGPMGFDYFLIAMCTLYAVKTRNVPENFNEAKFIGFTMYTTIVIWGAFFPIYFGSNSKVISLCLCISLSAIIALILLFFPKLYIILFKPEKNNRSFFTTARNVRCHIGYVPTLGISRHSSHSASDFSVESPRTYSVEQHGQHKLLHTSALQEKAIAGGFVEAANARAMLSASTSQRPKSVSSASTKQPSSNSLFAFFSRIRYKKKEKIKANLDQKLRAVRAAEALDRQTNLRRNRTLPRQSSLLDSSTAVGEDGQPSAMQSQIDAQKMKLLNLWKHAYLDEISKVPGLLEFIDNFKDKYIVISPSRLATIGKGRRAVSMVLPKSGESKEGKDSNGAAIEATAEKSEAEDQKETTAAADKPTTDKTTADVQAERSSTAVQTLPEHPPPPADGEQPNLQQQRKLQHLQNVSIIKTPLSRLRPCTRTGEEKRLDYERTIAELKQQAVEVESRVGRPRKVSGTDHDREADLKKDDWTMDSNNNKRSSVQFSRSYSRDDDESELESQLPTIIPPPPLKYSMLTRQASGGMPKQEQRLLDNQAAAVAALQNIQSIRSADPRLPTAEELILRVNQLSCEPSGSGREYAGQAKPIRPTAATSTVRVQSQYRSPSFAGRTTGTTIFSHVPPPRLESAGGATIAAQADAAMRSKEAAEKNRAYHLHQRVPSWSKEQSAIRENELAILDLATAADRFEEAEMAREAKQSESRESLIIEESASENEEDSSAAIYKKIIISLRTSTTDLPDCDYLYNSVQQQTHYPNRSSSQTSHYPHLQHQQSSTSSSSNQRHSSAQQSDHAHHSPRSYQSNYAAFYDQMQQLHQQHRHHHQQPAESGGFHYQGRPSLPAAPDYSVVNVADEPDEELISAFSIMSRSEPNSGRQSRKY